MYFERDVGGQRRPSGSRKLSWDQYQSRPWPETGLFANYILDNHRTYAVRWISDSVGHYADLINHYQTKICKDQNHIFHQHTHPSDFALNRQRMGNESIYYENAGSRSTSSPRKIKCLAVSKKLPLPDTSTGRGNLRESHFLTPTCGRWCIPDNVFKITRQSGLLLVGICPAEAHGMTTMPVVIAR